MTTEKRAELKIAGMVCTMCSSAIEKSLSGLSGVSQARVNLATETATVEYDPSIATLSDLEKAVKDAEVPGRR